MLRRMMASASVRYGRAVLLAPVLALLAPCATSRPAADNTPPDQPPAASPSTRAAPAPEAEPAPPTGGVVADAEPAQHPDEMHRLYLHVLDVGQGSALLIEAPCGAVLVDTGGELDQDFDSVQALTDALDAFFARRTDLHSTLDGLVITHPHIDHVRGVPAVLERYKVRNVVDNGQPGDDLVATQMAALHSHVEGSGVGHRSVALEELGPLGLTDSVVDPVDCQPVDPHFLVLSGRQDTDPGWGSNDYHKRHFDNANNHSVVLRVDFGRASALITGDTEAVALADLVRRYEGTHLLDVDVYVVGHHGSRNGTTRELVAMMTPKVAVMSMGPSARHHKWTAWQYGHPRQPVLDLLENSTLMPRTPQTFDVASGTRRFSPQRIDRAVFGTGWEGAITVELDDDGAVHVHH